MVIKPEIITSAWDNLLHLTDQRILDRGMT